MLSFLRIVTVIVSLHSNRNWTKTASQSKMLLQRCDGKHLEQDATLFSNVKYLIFMPMYMYASKTVLGEEKQNSFSLVFWLVFIVNLTQPKVN